MQHFRKQAVVLLAGAWVLAAVPPWVGAQEIPVMAISSLTGATAYAGVPEMNGIRLAIDQANDDGYLGKAKIKLIEGDYAAEKPQAISLAGQAIQRHKVVLALGPTASPEAVAVSYIFNEGKTPMLSFGTSNAITANSPWAFKIQQSGTESVPLLARYALEKTPVRRMAMIYDSGNDGLVEYKNVFAKTFKDGGGTVVAEEVVSAKEANFQPLFTKLMAMNLDGIFISNYAEQAANIMVQFRRAGMPQSVRFFGTVGVMTPRLVEIGGQTIEGAQGIGEFVPGLDRPLNKAFESAYLERYKTTPDSFAALGYSLGLVALKAIKDASPDPTPEKVRVALTNLRDVPVVVGNGVWNHKDRNGNYGAVVLEVKAGKFIAAP
ncbi:ABC transporter substrate-binding protein [Pseudorhodoferax sp.]|uniref:ABC transporter substrate-binding protein n=1 Tax=Pseudorhodoferax sp. TaxID=1993553 RepID=UPI0039E2C7E3